MNETKIFNTITLSSSFIKKNSDFTKIYLESFYIDIIY